MDWIKRYYESVFNKMLTKGKVLVIYGSRQVGKTSLINYLIKDENNVFTGDGNDSSLKQILESQSLATIQNAFRSYDIVFIDEAQKIRNIGNALKLLVDHESEIKIIASGSSSFDLSNKLGEPLTGRQKVYKLYPLSVIELVDHFGGMHVIQQLESLLIHGGYPEVITANNNVKKIEYLLNLRDSFLFRDILELENIRNSSKLLDLLRLLAFQIGSEVIKQAITDS